jgi:hypothetical protein
MQIAPAGQHLAISDMQFYLQDSKLRKAIIRRLRQSASATSVTLFGCTSTTVTALRILPQKQAAAVFSILTIFFVGHQSHITAASYPQEQCQCSSILIAAPLNAALMQHHVSVGTTSLQYRQQRHQRPHNELTALHHSLTATAFHLLQS